MSGGVIDLETYRARRVAVAARLVRAATADICPHCGEPVQPRSFAAQLAYGMPVYHGACFWAAHTESKR